MKLFDNSSDKVVSKLEDIDQALVDGFASRDIETERIQRQLDSVNASIGKIKAGRDQADAKAKEAFEKQEVIEGIIADADAVSASEALRKLEETRAELERQLVEAGRLAEVVERGVNGSVTVKVPETAPKTVKQPDAVETGQTFATPAPEAEREKPDAVFQNFDDSFDALDERINTRFKATLDGLTDVIGEAVAEINQLADQVGIDLEVTGAAVDGFERDQEAVEQAAMQNGLSDQLAVSAFTSGRQAPNPLPEMLGGGLDAMLDRDGGEGPLVEFEGIEELLGQINGKAGEAGRSLLKLFNSASKGAGDFTGALGGVFDALGGIGGKAGQVLGTLSNLFGGGSLEGLLGGLGGLFGFAGGGTVQPGLPVLVGERGPELFIPHGGGRIVNRANSQGMMARPSVTITQNMTFATDVRNSVRSEILNNAPAIVEASKRAVLDAMMRGGSRSPFR
ncbi:MAG: hypothetical protein ACE5EM_07740 [Sphingomonadales bacterium]